MSHLWGGTLGVRCDPVKRLIVGTQSMKPWIALSTLSFILVGCGSDTDETQAAFPMTLDLGEQYQAIVNMSDIENAQADFNIEVQSKDGSLLPDESVTIAPLMEMVSGMNHGTPMSKTQGNLDDNQQFTTTAYFLMPSGEEMGQWSFTLSFDGESASFPVDVTMNTADRQVLQGTDDVIMGMNNMTTPRRYFLFKQHRHVSESMNQFTVYIAARETMMKHTSIESGLTLSGAMGDSTYDLTIENIVVEMCAVDCELETSWITAMAVENTAGQFRASDLGLAGDTTDEIHVRLTVNDELKIQGDGTQHAVFTFTDSSSAMTHSM